MQDVYIDEQDLRRFDRKLESIARIYQRIEQLSIVLGRKAMRNFT